MTKGVGENFDYEAVRQKRSKPSASKQRFAPTIFNLFYPLIIAMVFVALGREYFSSTPQANWLDRQFRVIASQMGLK